MTGDLIVLGSVNQDFTVVVDRHPRPGETVLGGDVLAGLGGKGANQAVAGARAGATTRFIGAVGDDATGRALLDALEGRGVDVAGVAVATGRPTGVALITVSSDGENTIVVAAGANGSLGDSTVDRVAERAGAGDVLLAQLEVPLEVVRRAAAAAASAGARVVLNLSPARAVPDDLLALCDPLVVNASEAADLAGAPVTDAPSARAAAAALLDRAASVVVTLGGDGVVIASPAGIAHRPAARVTVVDTTGAGDAFVGALAARLALGGTLDDAVDDGIHAGAVAVQHPGAQPPA